MMLKVSFLVVYVKTNNICTYASQEIWLKDLEMTFSAFGRVSEMKIPSPSNCVFFLKFGDSRQETIFGLKVFVSSVEGFKQEL